MNRPDYTDTVLKNLGPFESSDQGGDGLLAGFKLHLGTNAGDTEDAQLQGFLDAAIAQFEFSTDGRVVRPTLFRQSFRNWPDVIRLRGGDVSAVLGIGYADLDDQEQDEDLGAWAIDLDAVPALLQRHDFDYPALSARRQRPAWVEFVCGFQDGPPPDVRLSLFLLGATYYANRESHLEKELKALPFGFQAICNRYSTGQGGI